MGKDKSTAVQEMLHIDLPPNEAKKYFISVYSFFLYNDSRNFLKILDFRSDIREGEKPYEAYCVFKYMLQLLQERYPAKVESLLPKLSGEWFKKNIFSLSLPDAYNTTVHK